MHYFITVATGTEPNSATEANVYINIFGEKGDTGKRLLHRSQNEDVFLEGQVRGMIGCHGNGIIIGLNSAFAMSAIFHAILITFDL